ncbi:MAG: FHA domain-containing protein [Lachnospiraceae bacterium]|nr:FHA domain-containing protein [Lachnospiraceae bacterium]
MNNEKSSSKRVVLYKLLICILLILFVTLGIFLAGSVSAFAGKSNLEESRGCVFGIKVFLTTDQGEQSYPIRQTSGFLVGDATRSNDSGQHILTSKYAVSVSKELMEHVRKEKGVPKDQKLMVTYKLVVSKDLELSCSVMNESRDSDFMILTPEQNIANRNGIPVLKSIGLKDGTVLVEAYYDNATASVGSETFTWTGDAKKDDRGNMLLGRQSIEKLGGPVLDASGNLVGMLAQNKKNTVLLSSEVMTAVMDSLGITYVDSQSCYSQLATQLEEAADLLKDTKTYTQGSLDQYKQVVDQAKTVYGASDAKEEDYKEQMQLLTDGAKQLKKKSDYIKYGAIVLAAVIAGLILIALVCALIRAHKKKKPRYYEDAKAKKKRQESRASRNRRVMATAPMTVEDFEKTVTVDNSTLPTAFLQSTTDGKQALINKSEFTLGKSREYCEYVVEGNRTISRRHARITNENGVFFIEDLQSMNHTYLNDKQLAEKERAVLRNGDHIRLANEEFIFLMR